MYNSEQVRALIGDPKGAFITDELIDPFLEEGNVYLAAASVLDSYLAQALLGGAGSNIRTDDLSINHYNNLSLLRDHARALRARGDKMVQDEKDAQEGIGIYWPGEFGVHPRLHI